MTVAVLFARSDSIYKRLPDVDVYDIDRDARNYSENFPVVAHPPCRAWGRLRHFAKPRPDEKMLACFAIDSVRRCNGVLEHPAGSLLWKTCGLPPPAQGFDDFGGWSIQIPQFWFGHRAMKSTWLYIVGCAKKNIPAFPLVIGEAPCVCETQKRFNPRPSITRPEREATPPAFAAWLVDLAQRCN